MPGYAIELDLHGRTVLVVGLGPVGRRKTAGLRAAGARVIGVDPSPWSDEVPEGIEIRAEAYRAGHLQGMSLAFAAGPPEVNAQVVADAKAAGIWVSSASDPTAGDFTLPAVWRAGGLMLTVATSGASPALAAALRDRAALALGPGAAGLCAVLAELRPGVLERLSDPELRRRILADWADPRWLDLFATHGAQAVRDEVERLVVRETGNFGSGS